jgi:lysophospholipase L1-like esterase
MMLAAAAMASCLIAGDSLAVGVGARFPACVVSARKGAPTSAMPSMIPDGPWTIAILSAGSNDAQAPDLDVRLRRLRTRVRSARVVWILPYDRSAASAVTAIAVDFGDLVVDAARFPTWDGVHPSDYRGVAAALR